MVRNPVLYLSLEMRREGDRERKGEADKLNIQSVPQRKHRTSPLQRSTG
jgi:hypothetical protein